MIDFLVNSLIASVVLTVLINVMARLFPGSSAEDRIRELVGEQPPSHDGVGESPKFRIWFPWKAMLFGSIAVSLFLNIVALFD